MSTMIARIIKNPIKETVRRLRNITHEPGPEEQKEENPHGRHGGYDLALRQGRDKHADCHQKAAQEEERDNHRIVDEERPLAGRLPGDHQRAKAGDKNRDGVDREHREVFTQDDGRGLYGYVRSICSVFSRRSSAIDFIVRIGTAKTNTMTDVWSAPAK